MAGYDMGYPERSLEPSKVVASAATGVINHIERSGGDPEAILGKVGIRLDAVGNPNSEINLSQYCELFHESARATGIDNFGLQFGQSFEPQKLGPIGYAAVSSPTLASAVFQMQKYFPAHQSLSHFGVIEEAGIYWLSYNIEDRRISNKRQDAELSLGMFANLFKRALGSGWSPLEVRFEHLEPDGAREHSSRFGAPVRFGRRTNAFAFRKEDLEAPMPDRDPFLFAIIEPILRARCSMHEGSKEFSDIVRDQIKLNLGESAPTLDNIAKLFGISGGRLHRQLKSRGLSFNDILSAARKDLALHYMRNQDMPLTEIALCLGYSELSAFSRAFRAWTGVSPKKYRRGLSEGH